MQEIKKEKILILGGGFGGIRTVIELSKNKINADITLVSNKNYFEYYPGLYRVVTGASPIEVCVPLTDILPEKINLEIDKIVKIDLQKKEVIGESDSIFYYDTLIIALGSQTSYFNLPGIADLSLGFKSVNEALHLKNHITNLFEKHQHPSVEELVSHFHIVIVGGGPSGIEVAGDLSMHMKNLAKKYKVDPSFITIDLIESNGRLLPLLPEKVSQKVLARIRKLGINVFLNRFLVKEEIEQVYMKDMSLKSQTVIWTAGTQINDVVAKTDGLEFEKNKKVSVNEYLQAKNNENVYVIGDAGATQYSGLAQTAIYDSIFLAENLKRKEKNKNIKKYEPKPVAFSIPVGSNWGVFSIHNINFYGWPAYILRHFIDFIFFSEILSVKKLFSLFIEGWKYRKLK